MIEILIVSPHLHGFTGTELYARDIAVGFAARGDRAVVYSPDLGPAARELEAAGITVADQLADIDAAPDVIYADGPVTALGALLRFPGTPAALVCHSGRARRDLEPPLLPRVRRYVAVDLLCRERLTTQGGVPEERVEVIVNGVDLERFERRVSPLPARARRALVFSNYASSTTHLGPVRDACARAGIEAHVIGRASGNPCDTPEDELPKYDIVFAKGRCAIEALAAGAAVVPCDREGVGTMVNSQNVDELRDWNFGFRTLTRPNTVEALLEEIGRYDAADAAATSEHVRRTASLPATVERLAKLLRTVIREARDEPVDPVEDARALGAYADWLAPHFASYQELRWLENSPLMRIRRRMRAHPRLDRLAGFLGGRIARMLSR